VKGR
jgi:hypothetical protein